MPSATPTLSLHGRCLAAVLTGGPGALLSHYSAAWLWSLIPTQLVPVHVTGPSRRHQRSLRFTRAETERRFLSLVEAAGLPRPATAYNEAGYELDLHWPELRFAVELDVFETHGTRESFEADRLRQEELKLAGVEMTRVTGRRLEGEPELVLERVGQLLDQRRGELEPLGRGLAGAR